jgi:hypothetical protein
MLVDFPYKCSVTHACPVRTKHTPQLTLNLRMGCEDVGKCQPGFNLTCKIRPEILPSLRILLLCEPVAVLAIKTGVESAIYGGVDDSYRNQETCHCMCGGIKDAHYK